MYMYIRFEFLIWDIHFIVDFFFFQNEEEKIKN